MPRLRRKSEPRPARGRSRRSQELDSGPRQGGAAPFSKLVQGHRHGKHPKGISRREAGVRHPLKTPGTRVLPFRPKGPGGATDGESRVMATVGSRTQDPTARPRRLPRLTRNYRGQGAAGPNPRGLQSGEAVPRREVKNATSTHQYDSAGPPRGPRLHQNEEQQITRQP